MLVNVVDQQTDLTIAAPEVIGVTSAVVAAERRRCDEVSVYVVDRARICALHDRFFDDPSPTDCISLPMDDADEPGYQVLGEVFICRATALEYAQKNAVDVYDEVTLYIVHSLLHLMGYDDVDEGDRVIMRAAEQRHLGLLRDKGLFLRAPGKEGDGRS